MIVKCPQCGVSYYETTEKFDPDKAPNGSMLRLRDPWKSLGWATYGLDRGDGPGLLWSDMECTGCSAPLAPSGKLKVVVEMPKPKEEMQPVDVGEVPDHSCPHCGKIYLHASSLSRHVKKCPKNQELANAA